MRAARAQLGCCCAERLSWSAHSRVDPRHGQTHPVLLGLYARQRVNADGHETCQVRTCIGRAAQYVKV